MKISELSTEELAPVLADLAEPLSHIANDDATTESLKRIVEAKGNLNQIGAFIREVIPLLLRTHFDSTCQIVATLTGKKLDEVKKQKGIQTIADAINVFDSDLIDFFKSFVHTERMK